MSDETMSDDEAALHFARMLRRGYPARTIAALVAAQARRRLSFLNVDGAWAWRKENGYDTAGVSS